MPTFKYGGISALTLSERITTPSLCLAKNGQTWYVPLFSGNKGSVVKSGKYNYTLGGFKVGNYNAAIDRSPAMVNGKFFWFDDRTMYRGYYSSDHQTIYITSHVGDGKPFFQIGGFDKSSAGKTVRWRFMRGGEDITNKVTNGLTYVDNLPRITRYNGVAFRNIDGSGFNTEFLGIKCFEGWMPNGVYDLILTGYNINYVIHLNMNDPRRGGYRIGIGFKS